MRNVHEIGKEKIVKNTLKIAGGQIQGAVIFRILSGIACPDIAWSRRNRCPRLLLPG